MNIESFLAHYQLRENPFGAEEARHDPVFDRTSEDAAKHPDFSKLLGRIDRPSTAVAFGEKGSGKTAIRILIGRYITEHNAANPEQRVLVVPYDEFNTMLDTLMRDAKQDADAALDHVRLEDHQDAILSLAVTRLVDAMIAGMGDEAEPVMLPQPLGKAIRQMPRQSRVDLAVLAALYDQPRTGTVANRWHALRAALRLGPRVSMGLVRNFSLLMTVAALAVGAYLWFEDMEPLWLVAIGAAAAIAAVLGWAWWGVRSISLWRLSRRVAREMHVPARSAAELRRLLSQLGAADLARQPFPTRNDAGDTRYQLTRGLLHVLRYLGHIGITVLVDRVDEPTVISGNAQKMRKLVWPMLDNKFLQQDGVGVKLLLPIELRHLLHRESGDFFQEARLDKQNMIDRLTWSGATLYDLCTHRLQACRPNEAEPVSVTDLFEDGVSRELVVDALDQMHQPRDAFKFLYSVIQEHCRTVPEAEANYKIPRLTLESVRRTQSQRVQELYRGLTPA